MLDNNLVNKAHKYTKQVKEQKRINHKWVETRILYQISQFHTRGVLISIWAVPKPKLRNAAKLLTVFSLWATQQISLNSLGVCLEGNHQAFTIFLGAYPKQGNFTEPQTA